MKHKAYQLVNKDSEIVWIEITVGHIIGTVGMSKTQFVYQVVEIGDNHIDIVRLGTEEKTRLTSDHEYPYLNVYWREESESE